MIESEMRNEPESYQRDIDYVKFPACYLIFALKEGENKQEKRNNECWLEEDDRRRPRPRSSIRAPFAPTGERERRGKRPRERPRERTREWRSRKDHVRIP